MSADTSAQPAKKPSTDSVFTSPRPKKNEEEKPHGTSAASPELQRNENTARAKPVQRVSDRKANGNDKVGQTEDEDDPCKKKKEVVVAEPKKFRVTPGLDPRFQQQDQTLRCFVMYTDFYRCENILGVGHEACTWFHDVFTSICPNAWIERWDEWRSEGRMPWNKGRTQGKFPGDRYGV